MKATVILLIGLLAVPGICRADDYSPDLSRIRSGLANPVPIATRLRGINAAAVMTVRQNGNRDSVWNGLLIGAAVGAGSGYIWARNQCGNDEECAAIANPIGIFGGAAIGAAVGAILDAFSR